MEGWQLKQKQSLPLIGKIDMAKRRIEDWYNYWNGNVYVSFSGGKDSTVLLHLVRELYPEVPAVFCNTGLEFPEVVEFVKTIDNVTWIKPKTPFTRVVRDYGYPVVSKDVAQKLYEIKTTNSYKLWHKRMFGDSKGNGKIPEKWKFLLHAPFKISHKCCYHLKKAPSQAYEVKTGNKGYVGIMASDSNQRKTSYLRVGCNNYDSSRPVSHPLGVWLAENIWEYLNDNSICYSAIYDKGYTRTGCLFCAFGVHMDKEENKFQKMKETHPKLYKYCMDKLDLKTVLDYLKVAY